MTDYDDLNTYNGTPNTIYGWTLTITKTLAPPMFSMNPTLTTLLTTLTTGIDG